MHDHWREFGPPVHIAVAADLGLNKPKRETPAEIGDFIADMQAVAPGGWG